MTTEPARPNRVEGVTLVAILLLIGGTAAAASFTHVHDVTVAHGQPDWIGWANAIVLELIALAVGLEIRRRRRAGTPIGAFTVSTLAVAVALSLAAQVAEAERSVWGWIVAALPAAAFLALVKIVLSRPVAPTSSPAGQDEPPRVAAPAMPETLAPARSAPARLGEDEAHRTVRDIVPPIPADVLSAAQQAAEQHQRDTGRPITRDALRAELRVSNATASDLLRLLRDRDPEPVLTAPAVPASPNGRPTPVPERR